MHACHERHLSEPRNLRNQHLDHRLDYDIVYRRVRQVLLRRPEPNNERILEEFWRVLRSPDSFCKDTPRWRVLPLFLTMSRSDGYGCFGRDKKWYEGDVPSHTQTWYNNAPCSNRLGIIQAHGLAVQPLIAGAGVPLMRTASWRFLRCIISSGLPAYRFSKVSPSNVSGAHHPGPSC